MDEICTSIGADSLGYVSLEALIAATKVPSERLCRACFDGIYPIEVEDAHHVGRQVMEGIERRVTRGLDAEGVGTGTAGGALDALARP